MKRRVISQRRARAAVEKVSALESEVVALSKRVEDLTGINESRRTLINKLQGELSEVLRKERDRNNHLEATSLVVSLKALPDYERGLVLGASRAQRRLTVIQRNSLSTCAAEEMDNVELFIAAVL